VGLIAVGILTALGVIAIAIALLFSKAADRPRTAPYVGWGAVSLIVIALGSLIFLGILGFVIFKVRENFNM
jgi:hypothetical protein